MGGKCILVVLQISLLMLTSLVFSVYALADSGEVVILTDKQVPADWDISLNINGDKHLLWGAAGSKTMYLSMVGPNGNVLMQNSWTQSEGDSWWAFSAIPANDGGYAVTGVIYDKNHTDPGLPDVSTMFLTKLDGSGNHLWTKTFPGIGVSAGRALVQLNDGDYMVFGTTANSTDGRYSPRSIYSVRTDADGSLLREKVSDEGTVEAYGTYLDIQKAFLASDGNIVLQIFDYVGPSVSDAAHMRKITPDGDILWERSSFTISSGHGADLRMLDAGNGEVLLLLDFYDFVSPDTQLWKIDASGATGQIFSFDNAFDSGKMLVPTDDGGFIVPIRDASGSWMDVAKFGMKGSFEWRKRVSIESIPADRITGDKVFKLFISQETKQGDFYVQQPLRFLKFRERHPGNVSFDRPSYTAEASSNNLSVGINRTDGIDGNISIEYYTVDGNAIGGQDYTPARGILTFGDNDTSRAFNVSLLPNASRRESLWFSLVLGNVSGGASYGNLTSSRVIIAGNDTMPPQTWFPIPFQATGNGTSDGNSTVLTYPSPQKIAITLAPMLIGIILSMLWLWLGKLLAFFIDGLKSYLQKQFSSREARYRRVTANARKPFLFGISFVEMFVGLDCAILLGIAFAYARGSLFMADKLAMIVIAALLTIVVSELARRFIAARYKAVTEYQFWGIGAITLIITAVLHQPFSRPARTIINKPEEIGTEKMGKIAMAPCVVSLLLSIMFLVLMALGNGMETIGKEGFKMGMMICVYSLMPFEPMDGKRVIGWSKLAWVLVFIPSLLFYLGMLLFVL